MQSRVRIWSSFKSDKRLHSSLSNIPSQMLHNRGDHLIFFHFPVQKGILNRIVGLGTSQNVWSKMSEVLSYCDPSIRMLSQPRIKKREHILPTALSF